MCKKMKKALQVGYFSFLLFQLCAALALHSEQKEIQDSGLNCSALDSCNASDHIDDLTKHNCHCGSFCSQLDTCCSDSPYKPTRNEQNSNRFKCKRVFNYRVFMIDSCPHQWTRDSPIEQLCLADAELQNDPMLTIPVTNVETGITYRNYFCFVCNNGNEAKMPIFWKIKIEGISENLKSFPKLTYDYSLTSWSIEDENNSIAQNGSLYPISLGLNIPAEVESQVKSCREELVSECASKWEDENVRKKCYDYMGIVVSEKNGTQVQYRNIYCAICNFDGLQKVHCEPNMLYVGYVMPFSQLLDINFSGGDKVGKVRKCDEHLIYDPFFKKCRVPKCALPGYSVRNGKCVKI